jgi:predicted MPP superfamily phosphohydrolase
MMAAGGASLCGVYPAGIEPHRVTVNKLRLAIRDLPCAWDGLTIAHMTDLHRSPFVSLKYLNDCVATANSLRPDLAVFTGDYITHGMRFRNRLVHADIDIGNPAELTQQAAQCMARARATYGVFASLGNHDHWFNGDRVTKAIESAGVPVLRNQNTAVTINGESLPIVGMGDLYTEGVDFERAFAGVNAPFSLVLMHNPDSFGSWARPGSHLVLAGHTHGGQVNLPLLGSPLSPSRFVQGLFRHADSMMYVNRGLGLIFPPIRINCPPEIALIQLQRA